MTLITTAQDLAHRAHDSIGQKRKYSGEPYWVHTDEVAQTGHDALVEMGVPFDIIEQVVAGYHLHDYDEDVVTKLKELGRFEELAAFEAEFTLLPVLTHQIVNELTDVFVKAKYPELNRAQRHARENVRLGGISVYGKTGKLADLISNTRSIVAEDKDFARVYLKEKFDLLPYLLDGSPKLLQQATMQTIAGFSALGLTIPTLR